MLEGRNHVSTFVDRRFGEASSTLTPEEKALERFTAERQSRLNSGGKKSRFNLEDDDDEAAAGDDGFTHGGQKLGFGDEEELEHGGWGGLGAAVEGGASSSNREPLLRRRMAEAKDEDDVTPFARGLLSLRRHETLTVRLSYSNPNVRRPRPKSWKRS